VVAYNNFSSSGFQCWNGSRYIRNWHRKDTFRKLIY